MKKIKIQKILFDNFWNMNVVVPLVSISTCAGIGFVSDDVLVFDAVGGQPNVVINDTGRSVSVVFADIKKRNILRTCIMEENQIFVLRRVRMPESGKEYTLLFSSDTTATPKPYRHPYFSHFSIGEEECYEPGRDERVLKYMNEWIHGENEKLVVAAMKSRAVENK